MAQVTVLNAADSREVARQIHSTLGGPGRRTLVRSFDRPRPRRWDQLVFLFMMSPESLAKRDLVRSAREITGEEFPLLPVGPELGADEFTSIPADPALNRSRNAVGVAPEVG